ncbi:transcriptional repressor [bacterium]|nr:transcriptional repressor [bacterium]
MALAHRPRNTRQRRVILDELKKVTSHPTAYEVLKLVRSRMPGISLATVYRNLELLSERGVIMRLDTGGMKRRYDGNAANHYHVRCIVCDRVADVSCEPLGTIEELMGEATDFTIVGHRLEFHGYCPACARQPAKPTA